MSVPAFPDGRTLTYTNWGRSALEAALRVEEASGGRVIIPAFIDQEAFQVVFDNLDIEPVFVDIDPCTYTLDPELASEHIDTVDAVVLVHPFGYPTPLEPWEGLRDEHDVALIEDCVRALGARDGDRIVGSTGDHAVYGLHKISPLEVGGAVVSDTPEHRQFLDEPVYDLRALYHLLPPERKSDVNVSYPHNYECRRLDDVSGQEFRRFFSEEYEAYVRANREQSAHLREELSDRGFAMQEIHPGAANFVLAGTVPESVERSELMWYLYENLHPNPAKPVWANPWPKTAQAATFAERYPVTSSLADDIVCFVVRDMDDEDVDDALDVISDFLAAFG